MADYTVGAGQDYPTISAALVQLASDGAGPHSLTISASETFNEDLDFSPITGPLTLVGSDAALANYPTLIWSTAANLNISGGLTLQYLHFHPDADWSGLNFIVCVTNIPLVVQNCKFTNPNSADCTALSNTAGGGTGTREVIDTLIYDYKGGFKYGVQNLERVERVTVAEGWYGIRCQSGATVIDCAAIGNSDLAFDGTTSVMSFCASSDATAIGEGSITNAGLDEFVDAANDDYRLAPTSQLIGAGSTGNNIGWDQATSVGVNQVLFDVDINTMIANNLKFGTSSQLRAEFGAGAFRALQFGPSFDKGETP